MRNVLMQAVVDWGVLTKQLVFGLVALTMGMLSVSAVLDLQVALRSNKPQRVRLYIARTALKLGVTVVLIEPLLSVLGVPDLPLLDWHVLLLIAGALLASAGALGVIVEDRGTR